MEDGLPVEDYQFEHPPKKSADPEQVADDIQPSGEVPMADRDAMNAVVDDERRKNRELEEKLVKAGKNYKDLEMINDDLRGRAARWEGNHKAVLWGAGVLLVMVLGMAVWSINEHLTEHFSGHRKEPIITVLTLDQLPDGMVRALSRNWELEEYAWVEIVPPDAVWSYKGSWCKVTPEVWERLDCRMLVGPKQGDALEQMDRLMRLPVRPTYGYEPTKKPTSRDY